MKKLFLSTVVVSMFLITSCGEKKAELINRFEDPELQKIYSLQDKRDSEGIKKYFTHKSEVYRAAAAEAVASVQDKSLIPDLNKLLVDKDADVRLKAAYAVGQCGAVEGEEVIINSLKYEKRQDVRTALLEALGKCGSDKGLKYLAENRETADEEGVVRGIYRYCLKRLCSPEGTKRVVEALKSKNEKVREYCSFYFARSNDAEMSQYGKNIFTAFGVESSPVVRMNLALATGKLQKEDALELLTAAFADKDYRVSNNALNSVRRMEIPEVDEYFYKGLEDKDIHVQVSASAIMSGRSEVVWDKCREAVKNEKLFWRVRVNLLKALLKSKDDRKVVVSQIKERIAEVKDNYERAALIALLGSDIESYKFLKDIVKAEGKSVVKMSALEALIKMRKNEADLSKKEKALEFVEFLKEVIVENDPALVTISCSALSNKSLNHKDIVKDTAFLKDALVKAAPRTHLEAKDAIEKTLKYFDPDYEIKKSEDSSENGIDWNYVSKIKKDLVVVVKTNKGEIHIQMLVNKSPGSVANFLKLIDKGYYKNNFFHRVVPNFVIQCGCNRGDGWGGPDYTIRSELSDIGYREGYVGMASAGKDTEGSQWFITHSPTPHLDGRYSIFGKVVKGLEVIHKIRRGDKISEITKLK